jgi:AcrR family transcriptional regulator
MTDGTPQEDSGKVRRRTAEERREEVIDAAIIEFATFGLHGASTETIAARAGISQPYVLRLFGTKKALFLASVERVCKQIMATWQRGLDASAAQDASAGPDDRLLAMGREYIGLVESVDGLRLVLQSFSSAEDPDVRETAHRWLGTMFDWVRQVSGADAEAVRRFFATGMMLTVAASIRASDAAGKEPWARAFLMRPID